MIQEDRTTSRSYVDIAPATPILPSNTSSVPPFWPTPHAEARVDTAAQSFYAKTSPAVTGAESSDLYVGSAAGSVQAISPIPGQHPFPPASVTHFPPVDRSQQLSSTPSAVNTSQGLRETTGQGLRTPPHSAKQPLTKPIIVLDSKMDDTQRAQNPRSLMGPPKTPSRMMQASPNMFPSLQFSPDLFSTQNMGPMTAPAYPQRGLFWDPATPTPQSSTSDQYYNPYQDAFDPSFDHLANNMSGFNTVPSPDQNFNLPMQTHGLTPFSDGTGYPAPFQTSPRVPPTISENPAQFLSSPARRFGGGEMTGLHPARKPVREVPAYHHQIQESKREMELEREKRRHKVAQRADDELIMKSVRRALSPTKQSRPGLHRSQTHSGVTASKFRQRQQNRVSFNDAASTSSAGSNASLRNGRSSPLKRTSTTAGLTRSGSFQKARTSVSLAIDENGVAKTVLEDLTESDHEMDDSDEASSVASSTDQNDMHVLHSQSNSFAFMNNDDFLRSSQDPTAFSRSQKSYDQLGQESAKRMNRLSLGSFSHSDSIQKHYAGDTIRAARRITQPDLLNTKGDAQKALRVIIQNRSRSTSTQGDYPSSRQSDASVQFHSSPPLQQSQFGFLSGSPTTVTDPDLATPDTDQESLGLGIMRCVCNSTSPGSSNLVQCESCSKWLHTSCVGVDERRIPESFVCFYCEQTPIRHPAKRSITRTNHRGSAQATSPLAHKSTRPARRK